MMQQQQQLQMQQQTAAFGLVDTKEVNLLKPAAGRIGTCEDGKTVTSRMTSHSTRCPSSKAYRRMDSADTANGTLGRGSLLEMQDDDDPDALFAEDMGSEAESLLEGSNHQQSTQQLAGFCAENSLQSLRAAFLQENSLAESLDWGILVEDLPVGSKNEDSMLFSPTAFRVTERRISDSSFLGVNVEEVQDLTDDAVGAGRQAMFVWPNDITDTLVCYRQVLRGEHSAKLAAEPEVGRQAALDSSSLRGSSRSKSTTTTKSSSTLAGRPAGPLVGAAGSALRSFLRPRSPTSQ